MSKTKETNLIDLDAVVAVSDTLHDVPVAFDDEGNVVAGFKVVDANSKRYRDAKRAHELKGVKTASVRRKAIDGKTDEGAGQLLDLAEEQKLFLIKACVVEIYGFGSGGKPVERSDETLGTIFARWPTIVDKIAAKIDEASGFLKA